ncbi:hypothetical protein NPIL_462621 [Nephila pilipes]|uniref:Uncharacterized protein n=1 Tax=Nephila pilipes TaxID=299642 RepID=A0A8X6N2F7_NEPPI|nr:hypothetical protein NPIL_462621 [Nephila pilipes]
MNLSSGLSSLSPLSNRKGLFSDRDENERRQIDERRVENMIYVSEDAAERISRINNRLVSNEPLDLRTCTRTSAEIQVLLFYTKERGYIEVYNTNGELLQSGEVTSTSNE